LLAAVVLGVTGCQSENKPSGKSTTTRPGTSTPGTSRPGTTTPVSSKPLLVKSGACGDAFFWAANAGGTVAVTVTVDVRSRSAAVPTSIAFTVPDPLVTIEIQRGRDLMQPFCNDVITQDWHVDSREVAVQGKGRITIDAPRATEHRGSKGRLRLTGLVGRDGTRFAAIDVKTASIGFYAG
jgi:hypothetical protein